MNEQSWHFNKLTPVELKTWACCFFIAHAHTQKNREWSSCTICAKPPLLRQTCLSVPYCAAASELSCKAQERSSAMPVNVAETLSFCFIKMVLVSVSYRLWPLQKQPWTFILRVLIAIALREQSEQASARIAREAHVYVLRSQYEETARRLRRDCNTYTHTIR